MKGRFRIGLYCLSITLVLLITYDAIRLRNVVKPSQIQVKLIARATLPGVPSRFSELIEWASCDTGLEWQAHAALYKLESNFDESSIHLNKNGTYDIGAGQANSRYIPEFWARYLPGVEPDPLNIKQNVIVCSRHFARMVSLAGSLEGGAIAYHRGLQAYKDGVKDEVYVDRFLRIYNEYKATNRSAQGIGPWLCASVVAPSLFGGALFLRDGIGEKLGVSIAGESHSGASHVDGGIEAFQLGGGVDYLLFPIFQTYGHSVVFGHAQKVPQQLLVVNSILPLTTV